MMIFAYIDKSLMFGAGFGMMLFFVSLILRIEKINQKLQSQVNELKREVESIKSSQRSSSP
jgi:hypothetical protein